MLYGDKMTLRVCTPNVTLPCLPSMKCRIHYAGVLCQLLGRHTGRGYFLSCNSWLFRPLFGSGGEGGREGGMLQQTSASFALDRVRQIHPLARCWVCGAREVCKTFLLRVTELSCHVSVSRPHRYLYVAIKKHWGKVVKLWGDIWAEKVAAQMS